MCELRELFEVGHIDSGIDAAPVWYEGLLHFPGDPQLMDVEAKQLEKCSTSSG